jgi:PTH1 family peptidyl-tRNA hydrolase
MSNNVMKLIVGLGNPGRKYVHTPHNIGFDVVAELAERHGCGLRRSFRFAARTGKGTIAGRQVLLVLPTAFMNNSGPVVAALARKLGAAAEDLIVAADDADLAVGQLRIREQGGSGGHKGLQSLLDHLGSDRFVRVRLGIGRRREAADLAEHVLAPWSAAAWKEIEPLIGKAADAIELALERGPQAAMNVFNARPAGEPPAAQAPGHEDKKA